jgi:hypothetical protein
MSMGDRQYRLGAIEEDGQHVEEDDDDRTELKKGDDDSPLVFDFLKRKRPMPSARRLDYMLSVQSDYTEDKTDL